MCQSWNVLPGFIAENSEQQSEPSVLLEKKFLLQDTAWGVFPWKSTHTCSFTVQKMKLKDKLRRKFALCFIGQLKLGTSEKQQSKAEEKKPLGLMPSST